MLADSPVNFTDPDGLYRTRNVPPERMADLDAAMALLRQALTNTCCAGDRTDNLLEKANDPNLLIEFKARETRWCGRTGFWGVLGLQNKLSLTPLAWNCCSEPALGGVVSLASTILHELRHQRFGRERGAQEVEEKCFGCTTGRR
jgi:hypothetical protein